MVGHQNVISIINEEPETLGTEVEEVLKYKQDFFFWIFVVYPLIGVALWAILSNYVVLGMLILMGMYSVPMLSFFKFAKSNKKRIEMLEKYWIPSGKCGMFKPKKMRYAVIVSSLVMAVEMFLLAQLLMDIPLLTTLALVGVVLVMGSMFLVVEKLDCRDGVEFTHIVETDSFTALGHVLAKEYESDVKISSSSAFIRIKIPETQQLLTLSKPERNKNRVHISIHPVNSENAYATKQIIANINRIIEELNRIK